MCLLLQTISDQVQLTGQLLKVLFTNLDKNLQQMSMAAMIKALKERLSMVNPGETSRKGVQPPHELILPEDSEQESCLKT